LTAACERSLNLKPTSRISERVSPWAFSIHWKIHPHSRGALGQLESAVLPVVLSEVLGNGSQAGLSAIVAKLQQSGLGDQVKSWIGNGQNLPITAEQLQQALGSDTVKQLAARFNIPVDQITPDFGAAASKGGGSRQSGRQAAAWRLRPIDLKRPVPFRRCSFADRKTMDGLSGSGAGGWRFQGNLACSARGRR